MSQMKVPQVLEAGLVSQTWPLGGVAPPQVKSQEQLPAWQVKPGEVAVQSLLVLQPCG